MSAALWLPEALRAEGCRVSEVPGWATRARTKGGVADFDLIPVGIICHHTAGHNDLPVVINGRSGLSGPLANLYAHRSGLVSVVAAGVANHAGPGAREVYDRARADLPPRGDAYGLGLVDDPGLGSSSWLGIEVENLGTPGDAYPDAQIDALVRACAAVCRRKLWSASRVVHHREWTRRKVDMSYHGPLRADVAARLAHPADQEDDAMTPEQQALLERVALATERHHEDMVTLLRSPTHASTARLLEALNTTNGHLATLVAALAPPKE